MSLQNTSLSPTYEANPQDKNKLLSSKMIDTADPHYKKSGDISSPQKSPNLVRDYDYPQETGLMKGTIISRLKSENEQLKRHVKDLNTKLTEHVKALALKIKIKSDSDGPTDEVMRRQLQNAYKQIDIYKKQLEIFEFSETQELLERVKKLEALVAEKDLRIEVLTHERKILERINRDQDKEIGGYKNSFGYEKRINQYYDEVRCLRDKISNMLAVNRHNEQNFRKQQKFLVAQTLQYRILCEVVGISTNFHFKTKEELEEAIAMNIKGINESVLHKDADHTFAANRDPNRGLHKLTIVKSEHNTRSRVSLKSVPSSKTHRRLEGGSSAEEDKLRKDILVLQSKILALETENKKAATKLKEKDQEDGGGDISSRTSLFESTKRNGVRHRSLNRINHIRNDSHLNQVSATARNLSPAGENDGYSPLPRRETPHPSSSEAVVKTNHSNSVVESIQYEEPRSRRGGDTTPTPLSQSPQKRPKPATPSKEESPKKPPVLTLGKEIGGRIGSGLLDFNDREHISNVFTSRLAKIVLWSDESYVYGIQAFYNMQNSFVIAGNEHIGQGMKKLAKQVSTLEIEEGDRIYWIYGRYTDGLTYLRMKTTNGKVIEAGNKDLPAPQKKFRIVLDDHENFAVLSGAHFAKPAEEEQEDSESSSTIILANIGFTVVKASSQE